MNLSPLQLKHYSLNGVHIEPVEGFQRNEEDLYASFDNIDISAEIKLGEPAEKSSVYGLKLTLRVNPKGETFPYRFTIGIEGFFEVVASNGLDDARKLAAVNGASVLYGILRQTLLDLTRSFENGPVMLPTLHFLNLKDDIRSDSDKVATTDSRRSKKSPKRVKTHA
jgi:preprotein translocase subunit SecB